MTARRISRPSTTKARGRPLGPKTIAIREAVDQVATEHEVMTVRQIFYALSSRGVVPKTENGGYRPVQEQVLRMRKEGLLPWSFIADGTRYQRKPESWQSVSDAIAAMQQNYRRNLWQNQGLRVEVWLEKDALATIVQRATVPWDVPLMVSRGTSSATFLWNAAQTAVEAYDRGITTLVFALYDYDAAGHRAARAVEQGLREHARGVPILFELIALNKQQIQGWNLPTRPAKTSDPDYPDDDARIPLIRDLVEAAADVVWAARDTIGGRVTGQRELPPLLPGRVHHHPASVTPFWVTRRQARWFHILKPCEYW